MKLNGLTKNTAIILIMSLAALGGCKYSLSAKSPDNSEKTFSKIPEETHTKITKEVLKERLGKKGIETVPLISPNQILKPNPLTLHLGFDDNGKFKLNNEVYEFEELVKKLNSVFKDRENNGIFREGTNEVEKEILLGGSDSETANYDSKHIYVEDFEKLVDSLRKAGIDQIKLDTNEPLAVPQISFPANSNSRKTSLDKKKEISNDADDPPRSSTSNSNKQNQ